MHLTLTFSKINRLKTGADVGHPAPGVHDQPSVAALVASYDIQAMKYNAYTTIQPPRLETIDQLRDMVLVSVSPHCSDNLTEIPGSLVSEPLMTLVEPLRGLYFSAMDCLRVNMSKLPRKRSRTSKVSSTSLLSAQFNFFACQAAIDELWRMRNLRETKPTVTFIVVGKRSVSHVYLTKSSKRMPSSHHVRFFPKNE